MGTIPGMMSLATGMMKKKIEKANIPSLADLQEMAQIEGVELVACKMTVDMMEIDEKKPIEGVVVWAKRKSSSNTPSRAKYACLRNVT
jgi:peroxiredoxin family protein